VFLNTWNHTFDLCRCVCVLQVLELTPVNALEPPKEKPPPPPVDVYPDDDGLQVQLPLEPVSINYYLSSILYLYIYIYIYLLYVFGTEFRLLWLRADAQAIDSLESAKRIKKEMWMKRSSFLGLEEYTNGNASYEHGKYPIKQLRYIMNDLIRSLMHEVYIICHIDLENLKSKPPDLTSFLEEERRLEKLLYNQNKPERQSKDTTRVSVWLIS